MLDRRKHLTPSTSRGTFQRVERRVRKLDRRKHHTFSRIIHIDVRNLWNLVVSKW